MGSQGRKHVIGTTMQPVLPLYHPVTLMTRNATFPTTEQGYDDASDLTLAMPNERIATLTQTASITN